MAVTTTYEHIVLNQTGVPIIEGTTTKIVEIVAEMKAYGWSPEEIHFSASVSFARTNLFRACFLLGQFRQNRPRPQRKIS